MSPCSSAYIITKLASSTRGRIIFIHLLCVTLSCSLSKSIRLARCFLF
nr:MAG TPA_asm: hypothetical protein [Caudoviricetes sp.]